MCPILFTIPLFGGIKLHTYGLLVALGFLVGITWVNYEAKRVGEPPEKLMDLCFYIVLAAIIGSRIFYVFTDLDHFLSHPLDFFKIWEGGLVFYGGLIGAVVVSVWYMRKNHLKFWRVADIFAPGAALGHVLGRLGCFSAGCCYGKPVSEGFPWGVTFPSNPESLAPAGISIYPTQLMEAGAEFAIFWILFFFRKKKQFDGQVLLLYLILYSIVRSILEIYRGDLVRGFLFGGAISVSQFISFLIILTAVVFWVIRARHKIKSTL
jgi:phosphatidylglycerol:prolipoprotein diacylglycerol transferase